MPKKTVSKKSLRKRKKLLNKQPETGRAGKVYLPCPVFLQRMLIFSRKGTVNSESNGI